METKRKMTKSPTALLKTAMRTAKASLSTCPPDYSHYDYTQYQLIKQLFESVLGATLA